MCRRQASETSIFKVYSVANDFWWNGATASTIYRSKCKDIEQQQQKNAYRNVSAASRINFVCWKF